MSKKLAITGGSRGIGRGIVRRMAKEGYDIAFTYSSERGKAQAEALVEEVTEKYAVKCFMHQFALNEKGTAEEFVRTAYDELGGLDLLICNAGQSLVNSIYEMDEVRAFDECTALRFNSADEAWLNFVSDNRSGNYSGKVYDFVFGPVANDDVYTTFALYTAGVLSKEQTLEALKIKKLYNQLVLCSERALSYLKFIGTVPKEEL